LNCLEIDQRLVVVERGPKPVVAGLGQITLCLEDEEARGRADGELPLLGLEPPLGELTRQPRRIDTLLVGDDLPPLPALQWRPAAVDVGDRFVTGCTAGAPVPGSLPAG
jgi:hypothetical protein